MGCGVCERACPHSVIALRRDAAKPAPLFSALHNACAADLPAAMQAAISSAEVAHE
ncbi:MAG: hypothetical protein ACOX2L_10150 [Anaerolineae bacterium]